MRLITSPRQVVIFQTANPIWGIKYPVQLSRSRQKYILKCEAVVAANYPQWNLWELAWRELPKSQYINQFGTILDAAAELISTFSQVESRIRGRI